MSARPKRSGAEPPPLVVWYGVAAALLAFSAVAAAVPGPDANVVAAYRERIEDFARRHRGSSLPRVVLLGTSLAYRAVPTGEETSRRLGDLAFLKLARPGIRVHFYDELLDPIFALEPDLILLQTELFREAGFYPVTEARRALRLGLRGQWGGRKEGIDPPDFADCRGRQSPEQLAAAVANLEAEFPRFSGVPRSGRRLLDRAAEAGVPVVLLDLPRSPTLEVASGGRADAWRAEVAAELAPWPGLRTLRWDARPGDALFCDFAHLKVAGRERFVRWLGPELRRLLGAAGAG